MEIQISDWGGSPLYTIKIIGTDTIMLTVHGYEGDTLWKYLDGLADLLEKNFAPGAGYYLVIDLTVPEKNMMLPFDSEVHLFKEDVLRRIQRFRRLATVVIISGKGIFLRKSRMLTMQIGEEIPYITVGNLDEAAAWIESDRISKNS